MSNNEKIEVDIPDGVSGDWSVQTYEVSEDQAKLSQLRASINGRNDGVVAGTYKLLKHKRETVMSNTPMEYRTNRRFISVAKGNVLINGLGLGMVLNAILAKPEVNSIRVIEKNEDVIKLVGKYFEDHPKVEIIHADAFEYKPEKGERFDVVWHDIWTFITSDNLPEMTKLHRKYGKISDWQASWCRSECERAKSSSFGF